MHKSGLCFGSRSRLRVCHPNVFATFEIDLVPENNSSNRGIFITCGLLHHSPRMNVTDLGLRPHISFRLPKQTVHLCGKGAAVLAYGKDRIVPGGDVASIRQISRICSQVLQRERHLGSMSGHSRSVSLPRDRFKINTLDKAVATVGRPGYVQCGV